MKSRRGRAPRLPRSYRAGRLLSLLAGDLPSLEMVDLGPGHARFVTKDGHLVFEVVERVERRFLGHNEIAQFRTHSPGDVDGPGRLRVRHTGALRRVGVQVEATKGVAAVDDLAARASDDAAFETAALPLDFTKFEAVAADGEWVTTIELMGATHITIALPPMRNYVRLYPDQADALLSTLAQWRRLLTSRGSVPGN
ncbi:MAG: DUF3156 family protein [Acidimicrobiia bacterium]